MPDYPYETDYNDHFETPFRAYQDISSILNALLRQCGVRAEGKLYDPYYCTGRAKSCLEELGYDSKNVIHRKRDFYKDIENKGIPEHDIFLTNPPYSDTHKTKCLDFAVRNLREKGIPFILLMPDYVANKQYFRKEAANYCIYFRPKVQYNYDHPEGTGKESSPFGSLWFCGMNATQKESLLQAFDTLETPLELFESIQALQDRGIITKGNRQGARARQRRKRKSSTEPASVPSQKYIVTKPSETKDVERRKNKSKYRDTDGNRKKKRF